MERRGNSTVEVGANTVTRTSERLNPGLTPEEERVLRMRRGEGVDVNAPLARASGGREELEDELALLELQLFRSQRARAAEQKPSNTANAARDKIVQALRKRR